MRPANARAEMQKNCPRPPLQARQDNRCHYLTRLTQNTPKKKPPSTSGFIFAAWKHAARCHSIREYGKFLPAVMGRDPTLSADV